MRFPILVLSIVVAVFLLMAILPFYVMLLLSGIPFGTKAEPAYVNGLITANGIFLGVILSATITRGKELGLGNAFFLFLPTVVFFGVMYAIFPNMIRSNVTVSDLMLLGASLLFSVVFFWVYLFKPFEKKEVAT